MKQVSNDYKNAIIDLGRQYDVKITYGNTTLTNEQLNEVTPHYRADLLKSVMKQLDLDSNVDIPIGTEINCQFGLKVREGSNLLDVSQTKLGYSIDSSTGETTPGQKEGLEYDNAGNDEPLRLSRGRAHLRPGLCVQ